MYSKKPELASLLSSRICHDLVSPLGAISNGLELMELSGAPRTAEYELMASSVQSANAKVNFFRIAYGPSGTQEISFPDIERTLSELYANTRYTISWKITDSMARTDAKLCFLMIQCLENTLPRGGEIQITRDAVNIYLTSTGPKITRNAANWDHLLGKQENDNLQASEVHFELAREAVTEGGKTLQAKFTDTSAEITL